MVSMALNKFVLRKHLLNFYFCRYFIMFFSFQGTFSVKTGRNQFPVVYKLLSVTVLCSTNGLFVLILSLLNFLSITACFLSSVCFRVILSHY